MRFEVENSIQIRYHNQIYEVAAGLTLLESLSTLGIDPESVLAIREGEMIGGGCRLEAGDEVRLVAVISGGGPSPLGPHPWLPRSTQDKLLSQAWERGNDLTLNRAVLDRPLPSLGEENKSNKEPR